MTAMRHPDHTRTDSRRTVVAIARELKELIAGCAAIGLVGFLLLLRSGRMDDHHEAETAQQPECAGTLAEWENGAEVAGNRDQTCRFRAEQTLDCSKSKTQTPTATGVVINNSTVLYQPQISNTLVVRLPGSRNTDRLCSREHRPAQSNAQSQALFGDGLHKFWSHRYEEAIGRFQAARQIDPSKPAHLYFLALAHLRLGQVAQADRALAEAVELEARHPVAGWGRIMERVQGKDRVWLEEARITRKARRYRQLGV